MTKLQEPVNLSKLLRELSFTDEELIEAARIQPGLFAEAARYRIQKMRQRNAAEAKLNLTQATIELRIRRRLKEDNEKTTEGQVKALALKKPEVQEAIAECNKALEEEEFSKLLLEAFKQRRDACRIISDHVGYEVAAARVASGEVSPQLRKLREALNEKYKVIRKHDED